MTSNRFFIKKIPTQSSPVYLEADEHHHLNRVVRIKEGQTIWLFDEEGFSCLAKVEEIDQKRTRLCILERYPKQTPNVHITLGLALIKSKRMEWVIRKMTELNAGAFLPVICSRSVVKIQKKIRPKMDRWRRLVREASKQCGRSQIPEIHPPEDLIVFLRQRTEERKFFLNESGGIYFSDILIHPYLSGNPRSRRPRSVVILVGPEGGWTEDEEQDIVNNNFEAVSLGSLTMRSETAAIASLALVSHLWNK